MSYYPLTDHRREELREQGIFPRSLDLDLFGLFTGFVLGLFFLKRLSLFEEFSLERIISAVVIIPLFTAMGVVASSLVQSRFLFRFRVVRQRPDFLSFRLFFSVVKGMVWTGVLYLLLRYLLNSNFSLTELGATVTRLSGLALLPLFVLGIVGRFVVGLLFVQRYAMTKEEIQAEAQESEVRPEFRRARSQ
jgi:flagellar biosynthesis protein FlhB